MENRVDDEGDPLGDDGGDRLVKSQKPDRLDWVVGDAVGWMNVFFQFFDF